MYSKDYAEGNHVCSWQAYFYSTFFSQNGNISIFFLAIEAIVRNSEKIPFLKQSFWLGF